MLSRLATSSIRCSSGLSRSIWNSIICCKLSGTSRIDSLQSDPESPASLLPGLEGQAAVRTIGLELGRFGRLDPAKEYRVTGAPSRRSDDRFTIDAAIPSHGQVLVEVV